MGYKTKEQQAEYNKAYRRKINSDPMAVAKRREYEKEYRRVYTSKNRQKLLELNKNRRHQRKLDAINYLGGKCVDCNGVYEPPVYDFHHIDPNTKEFSPGMLMAATWEKLKQELDKCVLLCSNCHRMRHYKREFESV